MDVVMKGTGVFRRYVPPEFVATPRVDLTVELSCVLGTSEPYQAPTAPRRGMYDETGRAIIHDNARVSVWSSNKKKRGKKIVYE